MQKLIFQCGLALGDIVMLTAAVRDLHYWYPGRFLTDVRTCFPDLWEHNPHISQLSEDDPGVKQIDCSYPLINQADRVPYHCLHGFIDFLNQRLHLSIKPTRFKGDIHLAPQEKVWASQVHEVTGEDTPFWIVAAGGKYDVTIKWWESRRYQAVVDYFRGKLLFVQVGQVGHYHPKLKGVVDLRGRTSLRELIRLVYHAQGVLCSVTGLMHLAAAVETRPGQGGSRACVVVAGGREPAHWEAYPGHQFIHTAEALSCCRGKGCWKDRTARLRDGDKRDIADSLCVHTVRGLPRCMDLITPEEVIRRIELYYAGAVRRFLKPQQRSAAQRGVAATAKNSFDRQPLNIHNAGMACDQYLQRLPPYPGGFTGRGILICGGGVRYFTNAWVCVNMLRRLGCSLPVELWHLGSHEIDDRMRGLVRPLNVECVDALKLRKQSPARNLHGWELKSYALLHTRFCEILLLDADNVPVVNPEFLFDSPQFELNGAIFWPDYSQGTNKKARSVWRSCGLRMPSEPEFESGQIVVDKQRCWQALCLSQWFNDHSDFYYQYLHGDKETFHLAFRKLRKQYSLVPHPIHPLERTMCQHDFEGRRLFQHRNLDKWDLLLCNRQIKDFWFEKECRAYVIQLRQVWNGIIRGHAAQSKRVTPSCCRHKRALKLEAVMISCAERDAVRQRTLLNLGRTDWHDLPLHIQLDERSSEEDPQKRQTQCARLALTSALMRKADYLLFLEDDLDFNLHLRHNLNRWPPLKTRSLTAGSLYNPRLREQACDVQNNSRIVAPSSVFGSQALIISRPALEYIVRNWWRVEGMQDIRISRLAARLGKPILYHAPSLVQHIGNKSTWGAWFHQAGDFDPDWKAL